MITKEEFHTEFDPYYEDRFHYSDEFLSEIREIHSTSRQLMSFEDYTWLLDWLNHALEDERYRND